MFRKDNLLVNDRVDVVATTTTAVSSELLLLAPHQRSMVEVPLIEALLGLTASDDTYTQ